MNRQPSIWNYVAGVLVGVLVIKYSESLDSEDGQKPFMLFASPAITVLTSFLLAYLTFVLGYLVGQIKYYFLRRRVVKFLEALLKMEYWEPHERDTIRKRILEVATADHERLQAILDSTKP